MYGGGGVGVSQFTRDFAYVRPGTFVVYDRTTVGALADQWLAWHTAIKPVPAATADATQSRYDVLGQGSIIGSLRTLLPRGAAAATANLVNGAAWRLEMHAPTQVTTQDWLTVVTAGNAVPEQTRLSGGDGNVVTGALVGVHVLSAPRNAVVLFAADHAAITTASATRYAIAQTADADHVIFDMAPSLTGYAVTASVSNGTVTVDVAGGGPFALTAQGTLSFAVRMDGSVDRPSVSAPPPAVDAGSASGAGSTTGATMTTGTPGGSSGATIAAGTTSGSNGATSGETGTTNAGSGTGGGGTTGSSASPSSPAQPARGQAPRAPGGC
jgi:hypothetical protein